MRNQYFISKASRLLEPYRHKRIPGKVKSGILDCLDKSGLSKIDFARLIGVPHPEHIYAWVQRHTPGYEDKKVGAWNLKDQQIKKFKKSESVAKIKQALEESPKDKKGKPIYTYRTKKLAVEEYIKSNMTATLFAKLINLKNQTYLDQWKDQVTKIDAFLDQLLETGKRIDSKTKFVIENAVDLYDTQRDFVKESLVSYDRFIEKQSSKNQDEEDLFIRSLLKKKRLTLNEIAFICKVTYDAVYKWIIKGQLKHTATQHYTINRDDLVKFMMDKNIYTPVQMRKLLQPGTVKRKKAKEK